jgi:AraC-like DNA-binding protein
MVAIATTPTRQRWSTADVESRHALAYWVDTICSSFLEIDIDSPNPEQFRGRLEQSHLGPATLSILDAETQTVRRTPARLAQSRYAAYFLLQLRSGQLRFQQFGRECCIEPGDCVLIDCNAQYRLECLQPTRSIALRFPREWLRNWIPSPESLAGRPLRGGSGWGSTLAGALANLDSDEDMELALPEGVVAEQIAALLALAAGPDAHASGSTMKLLNRIRRTIRDRCHEPNLTPAAVADEHRISKRYLHHLFAHVDSTFGDELMRQRLDCAQRMLSDARFAMLKVSDIAARCGFMDPSHFTRRFRKAYGARPAEFRAARVQFPLS